MLTNEVDTNKVEGEKETDTCHEIAVANFVKENASNKSWETVCYSTEKSNFTPVKRWQKGNMAIGKMAEGYEYVVIDRKRESKIDSKRDSKRESKIDSKR